MTIWNRSLRVLPGPPGRRSYTTIQPGTRYSSRSSYGPARAPGNTGNTQRAIPFMAYSIRLRWPPWPSCAAATLRQPALLLDRAGDLPKAVPGGGPLAGLPGRAGRLPVVPRRSARRPRRAGWRPVIPPEFFLPGPAVSSRVRHRFPTGRHREFLWPRLSQQRHQPHRSQRTTNLTLVPGPLVIMPLSAASREAPPRNLRASLKSSLQLAATPPGKSAIQIAILHFLPRLGETNERRVLTVRNAPRASP